MYLPTLDLLTQAGLEGQARTSMIDISTVLIAHDTFNSLSIRVKESSDDRY